MTRIQAGKTDFKRLNEHIRSCADREIELDGCIGQRYIGAGMRDKQLTVGGIAGNALGAYLDGGVILTRGNAQDATGDTMNDGLIAVDGDSGDATGYSMRGGRIYVHGDAGYRAGVHMKQYADKIPVIVIGGSAGSFLGEYQAGGKIIVLGLGRADGSAPVGFFPGTGMHGGKIYLRCAQAPSGLPAQISVHRAQAADIDEIRSEVEDFCARFGEDVGSLLADPFFVLTPNSTNPYKKLYTYV